MPSTRVRYQSIDFQEQSTLTAIVASRTALKRNRVACYSSNIRVPQPLQELRRRIDTDAPATPKVFFRIGGRIANVFAQSSTHDENVSLFHRQSLFFDHFLDMGQGYRIVSNWVIFDASLVSVAYEVQEYSSRNNAATFRESFKVSVDQDLAW